MLLTKNFERTVGINFFSTATLIPPATAVERPIEAPDFIPASITSAVSTSSPEISFAPILLAIPIPIPTVPFTIICLPICLVIAIVSTSFSKLNFTASLSPD